MMNNGHVLDLIRFLSLVLSWLFVLVCRDHGIANEIGAKRRSWGRVFSVSAYARLSTVKH